MLTRAFVFFVGARGLDGNTPDRYLTHSKTAAKVGLAKDTEFIKSLIEMND